ncbi:MAG: isoprenylcysteine carboxylmethyltransferase family protein [Methanobacterium sp.]
MSDLSSFFPTNTEATIFQLVITIWLLSEIIGTAIIPRIRRGGSVIERKDRFSGLYIFATIFIALILSFYFAGAHIAMLPGWVFSLGILLIILGIILRQLSMAILGKYFSGVVGIQKDQKVIEKGPYKYVRHPSYTGALMIFIGLGLALQSGAAVLTLIVLFIIAYGFRMYVEEKALISELGEPYLDYKKRTKRLIPYVV